MIKLKSLLENKNSMIVYHGTGAKFRKFNLKKSAQGIIWFTSNKEKIKSNDIGANSRGYIITAEVTINNPAGWNEYQKYLLGQLKGLGYDGVILPEKNNHFDCFVFDPKQIKILNYEKINEKISEEIDLNPDEYYYHVTLAPYISSIKTHGLKVKPKTSTVSNYKSYSRGRIFFTDLDKLNWWVFTIAGHAFDQFDDESYHDIAIFRIAKKNLPDVEIDKVGSDDSNGKAYFVTHDIPPESIEFVKIEKSPY